MKKAPEFNDPAANLQNDSLSNINNNNNNNNNINRQNSIREARQKEIMEEYNRMFSSSTDREKQLTLQYFMSLASIENEVSVYPFHYFVLFLLIY